MKRGEDRSPAPGALASPLSALLAAAVLCGVPLALWYQSSRDDKGTSPGFSRYNVDQFNNTLAEQALNPQNPERDSFLLLYVENLARSGRRTAPLVWLKAGAERGTSAKVMAAYAEALRQSGDPAAAEVWKKRAAEASAAVFGGEAAR